MAEKKKKSQLWWINRVFLRAVWLAAKYSSIAAIKACRFAGKVIAKRALPAVASKVKSRKKPEQLMLPASYIETTPEKVVAGIFDDFAKTLLTKSQIVLIFGKRGSGKSALGFRIMENIRAKAGKPCFVLGVQQSLLPDWISEIDSLDNVQANSVVLVDEGALAFSARESMHKKNVSLGKMLATARHKDLTLLFITQNTGMIDKNVLNLTDVIMANEGSLLQKQMERPAIKEIIDKVDTAMKDVPKDERVKYTYLFSDDFEGLCRVELPGFWSQKISKSRAHEQKDI